VIFGTDWNVYWGRKELVFSTHTHRWRLNRWSEYCSARAFQADVWVMVNPDAGGIGGSKDEEAGAATDEERMVESPGNSAR
jgi:hypothetical protein